MAAGSVEKMEESGERLLLREFRQQAVLAGFMAALAATVVAAAEEAVLAATSAEKVALAGFTAAAEEADTMASVALVGFTAAAEAEGLKKQVVPEEPTGEMGDRLLRYLKKEFPFR